MIKKDWCPLMQLKNASINKYQFVNIIDLGSKMALMFKPNWFYILAIEAAGRVEAHVSST